jgi:hypothetical protein
VFGYADYADGPSRSLFGGPLAGRTLIPLSTLADSPMEVRPSARGKYPVWVRPDPGAGRPTCAALGRVRDVVEEWVGLHPRSFPPVVFHYAWGESRDGDPRGPARELMAVATEDGTVLVLNCLLAAPPGEVVAYPADASECPGELAGRLFEMSSVLPDPIAGRAGMASDRPVRRGARGLVLNAGPEQAGTLVHMFSRLLDVGTMPARNLPDGLR